jgi:hypothetical protein
VWQIEESCGPPKCTRSKETQNRGGGDGYKGVSQKHPQCGDVKNKTPLRRAGELLGRSQKWPLFLFSVLYPVGTSTILFFTVESKGDLLMENRTKCPPSRDRCHVSANHLGRIHNKFRTAKEAKSPEEQIAAFHSAAESFERLYQKLKHRLKSDVEEFFHRQR